MYIFQLNKLRDFCKKLFEIIAKVYLKIKWIIKTFHIIKSDSQPYIFHIFHNKQKLIRRFGIQWKWYQWLCYRSRLPSPHSTHSHMRLAICFSLVSVLVTHNRAGTVANKSNKKKKHNSSSIYSILLTLMRDARCLRLVWHFYDALNKVPRKSSAIRMYLHQNLRIKCYFFYCGCLNWLTLKRNRLPLFHVGTQLDGIVHVLTLNSIVNR